MPDLETIEGLRVRFTTISGEVEGTVLHVATDMNGHLHSATLANAIVKTFATHTVQYATTRYVLLGPAVIGYEVLDA